MRILQAWAAVSVACAAFMYWLEASYRRRYRRRYRRPPGPGR